MGAAPRILAILECRPTDDDVVRRAVELASGGGYLTIVAVAPHPSRFIHAAPLCPTHTVTPEELVAHARRTLARAVTLVPFDVPVVTDIEQGGVLTVAKRRAALAEADLVVARPRLARRLRARVAPALIDIPAALGQVSRIRTFILKTKEA
jgi:hypothetical protein